MEESGTKKYSLNLLLNFLTKKNPQKEYKNTTLLTPKYNTLINQFFFCENA